MTVVPFQCGYRRQLTHTLLQLTIDPARGFLCLSLRHQHTGETRLARTHRRFGERKVNEVALGQASAATICDVPDAYQPFDAGRIVTASEGKQRLAERRRERILRI
jgi:hypothetical protein